MGCRVGRLNIDYSNCPYTTRCCKCGAEGPGGFTRLQAYERAKAENWDLTGKKVCCPQCRTSFVEHMEETKVEKEI